MNLATFKQRCESYGGDLSRWPAHELADARLLLSKEPEAAQWLASANELDSRLDQFIIPDGNNQLNRLNAAIVARTQQKPAPASNDLIGEFINWLMPQNQFAGALWRPVMAASLPLVLGIGIGFNVTLEVEPELSTAEEIELLGLTQTTLEGWTID